MKKYLLILGVILIASAMAKKRPTMEVEKGKTNQKESVYTELMYVIKSSEGYSDKTYKCPAKVKTRGWGITKIELAEFNAQTGHNYKWEDLDNLYTNNTFLQELITWRRNYLYKRYPGMSDRVNAGLTSFTFNAGVPKLKKPLIRKAIKTYMETGSVEPLCAAIKKYKYVDNVEYEGLVIRRKLECKLIKGELTETEIKGLQKNVISHIVKSKK